MYGSNRSEKCLPFLIAELKVKVQTPGLYTRGEKPFKGINLSRSVSQNRVFYCPGLQSALIDISLNGC